jgi:hypothetical protein
MREYEQSTLSTAITDNHEEVDFYKAESKLDNEILAQSLVIFKQTIDELCRNNAPPDVAGQKIIHSLAKCRLDFAADLPYREEELAPESKKALELLNGFEEASRKMLEESFDDIFHGNPDTSVNNMIEGATAEECALRLVSQASPDARIFYPNEQDEGNGVDFFVVGADKTLAIQVKTIRYKDAVEYKMPLIYRVGNEQAIQEICDQALPNDGLDYRDAQLKNLELGQRIQDSLSKNVRYVTNLAPDGSVEAALMVMSTDHINPRLSEDTIDRLEKSDILPK